MLIESLATIGTLVLLEGILSVDNALAMALQVKHLEGDSQRKALFYGMGGAFVLRGVALLSATWMMSVWWLQIAGALYLSYLVIAHFISRKVSHQFGTKGSSRGFWWTIATVELTDAAFALDST